MFNMGPQELLIVLVLALIVVGPQRLPELSRQIGKGLREFRKVQEDVKGMVKFDLDDAPERPARTAASSTTGSTRPPGPHRTARPAPTAPATPANGQAAAVEGRAGDADGPATPSA
ncbi:MAG TPA: twin-arginine translocase TatA/TatE family subunit [Actinomycetota bacterium]|nr:twin-arginine translocase TatA/TatE family subunit [Actinomycetota bacterium]